MNNARHTAVSILMRVAHNAAFAAAALESELSKMDDPRDAALATEIVLGTLRNKLWIDGLLESAASKGSLTLDPEIHWILRVAVYQIAMLEKIPPRAAVSEAVEMIKKSGASKKLAGFANGILRNLARRDVATLRPNVAADEKDIKKICTAYSIPFWMGELICNGRGIPHFIQMAKRFNAPSNRTLRINSGPSGIEGILKQLEEKGTPSELLPWSIRISDRIAARKLEAEGHGAIQDDGAGLVVRALDPKPTDRILDACAGRGGKTGTIAMVTENKSQILAVDRKRNKLDRLEFDLHRQSLSAHTLVADLTKSPTDLSGPFDRILVDAPCTGTGTIGRRPEIRWKLEPGDVASLVAVQEQILHTVAPLVAPGGRLVFATCSVLIEEHSAHLDKFIKRYPRFTPVPHPPHGWPDGVDWNQGAPFIDPGQVPCDGYGILCLEAKN